MSRDLLNKYRLSLDNIDKLIAEKEKIGADYFILLAERSGSTPQFEGAYILINSKTSDFVGTVGGGLIEYRAICLAKDLAKYGLSAEILYTLNNQKASDLGMVCGGRNLLYILPIEGSVLFEKAASCSETEAESTQSKASNSTAEINLSERDYIVNSLKFFDRSKVVKELSEKEEEQASAIYEEYGKDASQLVIYKEGPRFVKAEELVDNLSDEDIKQIVSLNKSENLLLADKKIFVYLAENEPRVILAGGGHVSRAVSKLLGELGWNHLILEDREEMLKEEYFSTKASFILTDLASLPANLTFGENDYICIMTRGHMHDYIVLKQVLRSEARYIGVMGSKRKLVALRAQLAEDGFSDEEINSIYSPIGLDIDAVSLMEIAISIVAELIAVHRKKIYRYQDGGGNSEASGNGLSDSGFGSSLRASVGVNLPIKRK